MIDYHHITIFGDRHRYVLGPSVAVTKEGDWIVAFNLGVMREVGLHSPLPYMHPPHDPEYRNVLTRSRDQGKTWDAPRVFPGYDWYGVENPGLCMLANGDLLASVYQRKFYPLETGLNTPNLLGALYKAPYPWVVAHGGTYVHRSTDGGRTWCETVVVDTYPYVTGYSPRGPVELADGTMLLPLAVADPFDESDRARGRKRSKLTEQAVGEDPPGNEWDAQGRIRPGKGAAFVCISRDGGHTWTETREIARHPQVSFFEPTLTRLAGGRLICHLRTEEGVQREPEDCYLYQVTSDDNGLTWRQPWQTPMWGQPAHIVQLPDGRVLSVYGHRRPPYGIRACLSHDEGESWNIAHELVIRADLRNRNLGYPTAIVLADGSVFTVYWGEDAEGVTTIQGSYFKP